MAAQGTLNNPLRAAGQGIRQQTSVEALADAREAHRPLLTTG